MSKASLEQFSEYVHENDRLKEELHDLDEENFAKQVLKVGEQCGYSFTEEELREWIQDSKENKGYVYPIKNMNLDDTRSKVF